jgi:hypothetical protein
MRSRTALTRSAWVGGGAPERTCTLLSSHSGLMPVQLRRIISSAASIMFGQARRALVRSFPAWVENVAPFLRRTATRASMRSEPRTEGSSEMKSDRPRGLAALSFFSSFFISSLELPSKRTREGTVTVTSRDITLFRCFVCLSLSLWRRLSSASICWSSNAFTVARMTSPATPAAMRGARIADNFTPRLADASERAALPGEIQQRTCPNRHSR